MNFYCFCIEQLDLAAKQFRVISPSYGRFSLLITDNIVELMLHKHCHVAFLQHEFWEKVGKPEYNPSLKNKVLGQHFDEKVKFCNNKLNKISSDEANLILIAHSYRNELYHSGIKYDEIIYPLAWIYHDLATNLFERSQGLMEGWSYSEKYSEAVTQHAGNIDMEGFDFDEFLVSSAKSLRDTKPKLKRAFNESISEFAVKLVENIEENIEFLISNNPKDMKEIELIEYIQFYDYIHGENSQYIKEIEKCENHNQAQEIIDKARKDWKPKFNYNPIYKWGKRAKELVKEYNYSKLMFKFDGLKRDIAYFEKVTSEAAYQLDKGIQHELDVMREK